MTFLLAPKLKAWLLQKLEKALEAREKEYAGAPLGRLFYLALPPSVYPQVPLSLSMSAYILPS